MGNLAYSDLSVVIVDDLRSMRLILKSVLRSVGIEQVAEASDGEEALQLLKNQSHDLVITDLSMKPMNGIELTRRLRKRESGTNAFVPILMISGHGEKANIQQAMEAGVSAFLLKPITPSSVTAKLNTLLAQPASSIRSQNYYGPDRRRRSMWVRKCRRSTESAQ